MTKKEEELTNEGWEKRFIADEPRLSEMVQMYEETGFEVHLESISAVEVPDDGDEECQQCRICFEGADNQHKVIFTRPKGGDE